MRNSRTVEQSNLMTNNAEQIEDYTDHGSAYRLKSSLKTGQAKTRTKSLPPACLHAFILTEPNARDVSRLAYRLDRLV